MTFKLLAQRGAVLFLRPAAVLAEGFLIPDGNILVYVMPIAALSLTASSIPVHAQYMRTVPTVANYNQIERSYVSALLNITLISLLVMTAAMLAIWPGMSSLMVVSTLAMFIIEKFSDELTRFYEFHKRFNRWVVTQSTRTSWPFIPIFLAYFGTSYPTSFTVVSILFAIIICVNFFGTTGLRPTMNRNGWQVIRANLIFLNSAGLLALHRQAPRIAVAHLFPGIAHVFQALAQAGQGVSLLFNVRFAVPYRAIISRRTVIFERRMAPVFSRIMWGTLGLCGLSWLSISSSTESIGSIAGYSALTIAIIADSLAYSLMSNYWGYLPWYVTQPQTFLTYTLAILIQILVGILGFLFLFRLHGSVVLLPCLTVVESVVWISIIRHRHFNSENRNAK